MKDTILIAETANKMVDREFCLDDLNKGFDCLNSMRHFYEGMGIEFPKEFQGWTWENYASRWKMGRGRKPFKEFLFTLGREIDFNYIVRGDLLILEGMEMAFPAIYLGNDNIFVVFDRGCRVVPLKLFKKFLIGCRRLLD